MFLSMYQQNVRQAWDSNLGFFGFSKLPSNFIEGLLLYCKSLGHPIELTEIPKMHLQFHSHCSLVHNAILHFILNIS